MLPDAGPTLKKHLTTIVVFSSFDSLTDQSIVFGNEMCV